jgi:hypothetical protein
MVKSNTREKQMTAWRRKELRNMLHGNPGFLCFLWKAKLTLLLGDFSKTSLTAVNFCEILQKIYTTFAG